MTNREAQMEKWAAEYVIDYFLAMDNRDFKEGGVYLGFVNLFKRFHKDFNEQAFSEFIDQELQQL